jgi:hypothetical protein
MLEAALKEASDAAGVVLRVEDGKILLEPS